jgi:hypothetical protein
MEEKEKILGETYQNGKPQTSLYWIKKIEGKDEIEKFLKTSERYWFGEGYGSEKRKTDA